jgi:hypothetical protein
MYSLAPNGKPTCAGGGEKIDMCLMEFVLCCRVVEIHQGRCKEEIRIILVCYYAALCALRQKDYLMGTAPLEQCDFPPL